MGEKPLQFGDLVRLKGLEKPGEDVVKLKLGERKIDELGGADVKLADIEQLRVSDSARNLEDNENLLVSAMVSLVIDGWDVSKHILRTEVAEQLLITLQSRFENPDNMRMRHPGMEWAKIQAKLEANPDKLWSLQEMEKTGGEPDVVGYENGKFIFMDCSAESPKGRRNCVYDIEGEVELKKRNPSANYKSNAVSMAALMGVNILNEREYRELQTKGKFDENSWSWIKTLVDRKGLGVALSASLGPHEGVFMFGELPRNAGLEKGWRGWLGV